MKRSIVCMALLVGLLGTTAPAGSFSVKDKLGCEMEIAPPLRRVVFLSLYELIPVLDLWDRAVGINRWAFQSELLEGFPQLAAIPSVGTADQVNVETLLALRPDLVVTWPYKPEGVEFIRKKGIKTLAVDPESLDELYEVLELCGRLFQKEERAAEVLSRMEEVFQLVKSRTSDIPADRKKKVLWLWRKPVTVSGNGGIQSELTHMAGAVNAAEKLPLRYSDVSMEVILAWNPDVIFIWGSAKYGAGDLKNNSQWRTVRAVREGKVFKAPSWSTWSPAAAVLALWMARNIYPERFEGMPLEDTAGEFFLKCYGICLKERIFD